MAAEKIFSPEQQERYSRQILLREVGVEGQRKLGRARVLVVGVGGLGSPASLYLAAAGVGTIGIVDSDRVELSNLQRQIAHATSGLGRVKVESAAEAMLAINPEIEVLPLHASFCAANALEIIRGYDFVIDGTDNFAAKFLLNDACVLAGIPLSHAGVLRFQGQAMTILPGRTACYRCIFRQPPEPSAVETCAEAGVLGPVTGMLGSIQAAEALKYLAGAGQLLGNILLCFDALTMEFRRLPLQRQEDCPVCGREPVITEPKDLD
ncbi:MAG TPA: adenylyltransferase [Desulfobulbaceae bacterium]|nr:adenylyltransferase [Desulfobulbaceae bacterium]